MILLVFLLLHRSCEANIHHDVAAQMQLKERMSEECHCFSFGEVCGVTFFNTN